MTDFHTHILPQIDDGSRSLRESQELLEESFSQGVVQLVATPHFYAIESSFDQFLLKREESIRRILEQREQWGDIPKVYVGAEVYYFPGMAGAEKLPELCIRGTNLLLLEMPFAQWTGAMYEEVRMMLERRKLQIILAHIERYYKYQKDRSVWRDIWDLPVYPQINAGSFLTWEKRRFSLGFLKKHEEVLLGSDCHNMTQRLPNLAEGCRVIEKKCGASRFVEMAEFAAGLLEGAEKIF